MPARGVEVAAAGAPAAAAAQRVPAGGVGVGASAEAGAAPLPSHVGPAPTPRRPASPASEGVPTRASRPREVDRGTASCEGTEGRGVSGRVVVWCVWGRGSLYRALPHMRGVVLFVALLCPALSLASKLTLAATLRWYVRVAGGGRGSRPGRAGAPAEEEEANRGDGGTGRPLSACWARSSGAALASTAARGRPRRPPGRGDMVCVYECVGGPRASREKRVERRAQNELGENEGGARALFLHPRFRPPSADLCARTHIRPLHHAPRCPRPVWAGTRM